MNKQVLIVTSHFAPNVGGVETHLSDLVSALTKRKWKVTISSYKPLARDIKVPIIENNKNLTIYRMPWVGLNIVHLLTPYPALEFLYLFPGLFLIALFALIRNPEVETLHAQGLVPTVVAYVLGRISGRRVISSTHNLYFFPNEGLYTRFTKFIFSSVDKVLTLSYASSDELERIGVPKTKIGQFRYWLDLELFKPMGKYKARKQKGLSAKFVIFFVGRLIETKGVKVLLEASNKITNRDATFVFAGIGPLQSKIERVSSKKKNVIYVGRLDPKDVRLYMNAADIVAVPSTVDEGYGRVAMEAISCGTPVLAANVGGLDEVVSKKVGWLVEPNSNDFTLKINDLSKDKREVEKKAKRARKYALKNFSERNIERIIKEY